MPRSISPQKTLNKPDPIKKNDAYKNLVLKKFDDFEHENVRELKKRRADVERKARRRL